MSKNSIKNVVENLFLLFGRGKTQNRAKTHRPSMSAFSAIFVLKENGTQSHSAKFLNWGDPTYPPTDREGSIQAFVKCVRNDRIDHFRIDSTDVNFERPCASIVHVNGGCVIQQ